MRLGLHLQLLYHKYLNLCLGFSQSPSSHYQMISFGLEAPVKIQCTANELQVMYQIKVTTAQISWQKWGKRLNAEMGDYIGKLQVRWG